MDYQEIYLGGWLLVATFSHSHTIVCKAKSQAIYLIVPH
uniref:Serine-threonine protein kinase plant-type n=1 Tax=Rhizophora mucronata TaxID=61149 RepID=A0A2P2MWQ5_RHIMU